MKLDSRVNGKIEIEITGQIQSIQESMDIKKQLARLVDINPDKPLLVRIKDSYTMPSSIIGTLLELAEIEGVEIALEIAKDELYESLSKLTLNEILHIQKIEA